MDDFFVSVGRSGLGRFWYWLGIASGAGSLGFSGEVEVVVDGRDSGSGGGGGTQGSDPVALEAVDGLRGAYGIELDRWSVAGRDVPVVVFGFIDGTGIVDDRETDREGRLARLDSSLASKLVPGRGELEKSPSAIPNPSGGFEVRLEEPAPTGTQTGEGPCALMEPIVCTALQTTVNEDKLFSVEKSE